MEKLGQNNIYSQFLGQYPILRIYKGTDLINEYVPLYTPPVDWSDIRTDCPANSIAFYAGVKSDYTSYDNLGFTATCTNGYNVFIDGTQYGTTYASDATCTITWSTSGITAGDDITTPEALKAHIIHIVPAQSGNTITKFKCQRVAASGTEQQGILWAHFNLTNEISIVDCFYTASTLENKILTACTAKNNKIYPLDGMANCFYNCNSLEYTPVFIASNNYRTFYGAFRYCYKLKELTIKNLKASNVNNFFTDARSLEKLNLPNADFSSATTMSNFLTNAANLKDTTLDARTGTLFTRLACYGSSSYFMGGLKGLRVSNEAPFTGTAPQINVSYTGMDSSALRQLFYDLPYNVGYDIIGGVTIDNNDVATGFDCYPNSSAYLRVGPVTTPVYGFDSKIKVITGSSIDNDPIIGRGGNNFSTPTISFRSPTRIEVSVRDTDATILYSYAGDLSTPLQLNTTYYAVTTYNGDTWTWKVLDVSDNVLWTHTSTSISPLTNMRLTLGGWQTDVSYSKFKGSIDIKNSYINIQSTTNKGLVGYEIVGSPTINKGIASNFSSNRYLKSEQHLPAKVKTLEVNVEFTLPATISAATKNTGIVSWAAQHNNDNYLDAYVHINDNNNITAYMFRDVNNNYRAYSIDGYNLATHPNETFIANFKTDLSTVECKLYNKTGTLLAEQTYTNQKLDGSLYWEFYVGVRATLMHAFNGSVNLNNTYLVLDGKVWCGQGQELVPWFTRKENIVKKIACTGCTGNQNNLTIAGSPTINNGVLGGLSANNYVYTTISSTVTPNIIEIGGSFTMSADGNGGWIFSNINGSTAWQGLALTVRNTSDANQGILLYSSTSKYFFKAKQFAASTTYNYKIVYSKENHSADLFIDNVLLGTLSNLEWDVKLGGEFQIGKYSTDYFKGSINLNTTYIKVNGEEFFNREQYLLTEDKEIVTNKGWAFN